MDLLQQAVQIRQETAADQNTAERVGKLLQEMVEATGHAEYVDTQYTQASPLTITLGASNRVVYTNNAGTVYDEQKPPYIPTFWDSVNNNIPGRNGDSMAFFLEFKAVPLSGAQNVRLKFSLDIGGAIGEIYRREFLLSRGNGVLHEDSFSFPIVYMRDTWEANGGTIYLEAVNSDVAVYGTRLVFGNKHRARILTT